MDTLKIGRFIAKCRKEKGMTQVQLAEKLGVTAKTISRWENGNYMPDISMLQPLSEELGISLSELLSGERIMQEQIPSEELLEKTENSLTKALQYAAVQINQGKKKMLLVVALLLGCFVLVLFLLNHFLLAEIPYHEGDVEQWELLFPNHSAYEMAIGETGEPVFRDTDAALAKIKNDCSDAIKAIEQAYELPELSKYNYQKYRYYAGLAKLLFKSDEQVLEQRQMLIDFLDILEHSYAWEELRKQNVSNEMQIDTDILGEAPETETTIKVVDNTNANYEMIAYEKEIDMTADGVLDKIIFSIYVTEEYKEVTDTYELLRAPFVGFVKLYDGKSGTEIWKSMQISGDRLGNWQISLVTKEDGNYLLVGETQEQMGGGHYYYRVYTFENWETIKKENEAEENEQSNSVWLADVMEIVDTYHVYFVLEDECYRLYPNMLLRSEAVPDYKEHLEPWLTDAELIIATDVMMDSPNNIMFSDSEKSVPASAYYDLVWDRMKDQTAVFQFVCPEISFPKDEEWVQNLICVAADEQVAVAKYYDTKAEANCVFMAGSYTKEELLERVEYEKYLHEERVVEHMRQVEAANGESIDIFGYEIPFENAEPKKETMIYFGYGDKMYTISAYSASNSDVTSIMDMAEYMVERLK